MMRDQWFLTAAWAAMAATGAFSLYKGSESPKVDPTIAGLCRELTTLQQGPPTHGPDDRVLPFLDPFGPVTEVRPAPDGSTLFATQAHGKGVEPTDVRVKVLTFPVMRPARADLDGTQITWELEDRSVVLLWHMIRVAAKPAKLIVFRQKGEEAPEAVAELKPDVRTWTDLSAEPRQAYRYWVTVTGLETVRTDRSGALVDVTHKPDQPVSATAPSATRVKLVGGAETHAFLQVEKYDRAKKAWVAGSPVLTTPGSKVVGTGWSLRGLRFEKFTLVADMTDDDGAARVLSTRN
jgi:hypothetical protein